MFGGVLLEEVFGGVLLEEVSEDELLEDEESEDAPIPNHPRLCARCMSPAPTTAPLTTPRTVIVLASRAALGTMLSALGTMLRPDARRRRMLRRRLLELERDMLGT